MTCHKHPPLLSQMLDGELSPLKMAEVQDHLDQCARCRAELEAWRAQGEKMRAFLRLRALDESFVERVRRVNQERLTMQLSISERGWLGKDMFTWIQAVAAVLIVLFLAVQLFRPVEGLALARVLDPGQRLEVHSAETRGWKPIIEGATLRQGDWLRNPESTEAQLLVNDSTRMTIQHGALARLEGPSTRVVLIQGGLSSEVPEGSQGLVISTSAGRITARNAKFDVRMRDLLVGEMRFAPGHELGVVRGIVHTVGAVTVRSGSLEVQDERAKNIVSAGNMVLFSQGLTAAPAGLQDTLEQEHSLHLEPASEPQRTGVMISSLELSGKGLKVRLAFRNAPLVRALEWIFKSKVRGGDASRVSGTWSYPLELDAAVLAAQLEKELNGKLVLRQETTRRKLAFFLHADPAESGPAASRSFQVQRSDDGLISLNFKNVPAEQVFVALRIQGFDAPYSGAGEEGIPVTISMERIPPKDVIPRLERELQLRLQEEEKIETWIDWQPSARSSEAGLLDTVPRRDTGSTASQVRESERTKRSSGDNPIGRRDGLSESDFTATAGTRVPAGRRTRNSKSVPSAVWNVLLGVIQGNRPANATAGSASTIGNSTTLTASTDGKMKSKDSDATLKEYRGPHSRHWVWPVLSAEADAAEVYRVFNPARASVDAVWNGYDADGFLVWEQEMVIPAESEVWVAPHFDFGAPESQGWHWETRSNAPLAALAMRFEGAAYEPGSVSAGESAVPVNQFDAVSLSGMGGQARPWVINHGENNARILLTVTDGDRLLLSKEILLAPHASWSWDGSQFLDGHEKEIAVPMGRFRVIIQALEGVIAAGIRAN